MTVIRFNAGHGKGKQYNRGGIKFNEGDENYNFTDLLLEKLSSYDVDAKELRHSNGNGQFERDFDTIRDWSSGADLFYSAHSNAFNGKATGVEVFLSYKSIEYYDFAKELSEVISETLGIHNRGVKFQNRKNGKYETYSEANSSKNDWLGELYKNKAKCAVLVEHFFHDNMNDTNSYIKNKDALANAIVKVIAKHFNLKLRTDVKSIINSATTSVDLTNSIGLYQIKDGTNIRLNPSMNSYVKRVSKNGETVSVTEIKKGWARIGKKDEWFWLDLSTQIKDFDVDVKANTNIRAKPNTNSKIVDRFIKVKSTKIREVKNGWGLINSKKGWVWLGLTNLK